MPGLTFFLLVLALQSTRGPSDASLEDVLVKVEQYVAACEPRLSHCVARERYVQRVSSPKASERRMISDFLFLRVGDEYSSWLGIRNVLDVDGRRQAHDDDQLRAVILAAPRDAIALAEQIAQDNARFNVGVIRTINVPTQVLGWLHPQLRHRFRFHSPRVETIQRVAAWRIEFEEVVRPTRIRTPEGRDLPSTGTIWVDSASGRVLQTESRTEMGAAKATIRVRYQMDARMGFMVPVSMTDRVDGERNQRGEATYSDFRRFDVTSRIR
jgi:hypothetical protein